MSDKKHIDRLFQESFKDFEATPSDAVWQNIEARLNEKETKRRVIPIWWRYAGVAALLLISFTIGTIYFNNGNTSQEHQVTETEDTTPSNSEKNTPSTLNAVEDAIANSDSNENKNPDHQESKQDESSSLNKNNASNNSTLAKTPISENNNLRERTSNNSIKTHQNRINKSSNVQNNNAVVGNLRGSHKKPITNNSSEGVVVSTDKPQDNLNDKKSLQNELEKNTAVTHNTDSNTENKSTTEKNHTNVLIGEDRAKQMINDTEKHTNAVAKADEENKDAALTNTEDNSLTIEEAIDKEKEIIEEEERSNRWSIAPNAAPVYFNTLGEGSSIDPQLNGNSKSGELNMSYGISASYAINKRVKIRSGIHRVNLGYDTNNVVVFQTVGANSSSRALQNVNPIKTNNVESNDNVSFASGDSFAPSDNVPETFNTTNTTINQDLGYIEIPLEIQYALLDKKFGVDVIGGFSSFFLNKNKVFSEASNGEKIIEGRADNINSVSYSANLGIGFNYQVSKKIDLNLEPMFKYQINTFNNTSGEFKPYFIGVYTGFAIKF